MGPQGNLRVVRRVGPHMFEVGLRVSYESNQLQSSVAACRRAHTLANVIPFLMHGMVCGLLFPTLPRGRRRRRRMSLHFY